MTKSEEDVLHELWRDCRALIAALKLQRWDVCKWTVTVNITLVAGSIALHQAQWVFACSAVGVAILGAFLINAYNRRITGVRDRLSKIIEYFRNGVFDFNGALGLDIGKKKGPDHDGDEISGFLAAIIASVIPTVAVWATSL